MISEIHISPCGCDQWNGLQAQPNPEGTDGPLATLAAAISMVRLLREQNMTVGTVRILVQPGHYRLTSPLTFGPNDHDLVFVASSGDVVVHGWKEIEGWQTGDANGRACWVSDVGHLLAGRAAPLSLFANGERRPRARFPKDGWLVIEDVPDHKGDKFGLFDAAAARFVVKPGDFDPAWRNPRSIEAVVNHLWIEERMPVESFDPQRRLLTSTHRSIFSLKNLGWMGKTPCAKYFWENVFEALSEPGEWYLDPVEERLYYIPMPGETPENTCVSVPMLSQLVRCHGDIDGGRPVHGIHFEGITFEGTDWSHPEGWGKWWDPATPAHTWRTRDSFSHFNENNLAREGLPPTDKVASVPQAAHDLPGAISFEAATNCALTNCTLRSLGFYAIDVRGGCSQLRFQGNRISGIGGGGIKIDGAEPAGDQRLKTHTVYVGDNSIHDCGLVFAAAVGVLTVHASRITIEHNEIFRLFYTGISVGWVWGYEENASFANVIQYNHIHEIGMGRLSDMGGIYTLGVQPGTLIKGNHIHDVRGSHYGGWGIYLDQASSFMTVEANVVHHTNSQCFNEHWGRGNVVRDNLFALAQSECAQLCREELLNFVQYPPKGCLFLRNVFLTNGRAAFNDSMKYIEAGVLESDLNLFWDLSRGTDLIHWNDAPWDTVVAVTPARQLTLPDAQAHGLERHSLAEDPGFANPQDGDFRTAPDSPLHRLGIRPVDPALCGPRKPDLRIYKTDPSFKRGGAVAFGD